MPCWIDNEPYIAPSIVGMILVHAYKTVKSAESLLLVLKRFTLFLLISRQSLADI